MARRIIQEAPAEYVATCSKCGTKFAYGLEDISIAYANNVDCPKCGDRCFHCPVKLSDFR